MLMLGVSCWRFGNGHRGLVLLILGDGGLRMLEWGQERIWSGGEA
jgi:hypothetical protein